MKILNLDQFAEVTRRVNLGGVSYDVKEISVQDFCNNLVAAEAVDDELATKVADGAELSGREQALAARKSVDLSVAAIRASVPTMPEKVIRAQSFSVLGALLQFIRGELDPALLVGGAGAAAAAPAEGAEAKRLTGEIEELDLGYLIARVCRVYSQTYAETMAMPMRAFWQLSGFVERLLTAEHIDQLQLLITAQRADGDGVKGAFDRMGQVAPSPVRFSTRAVVAANSVRDEEGFNALRGMS